jgi:hypothetical protein
MIQTSDTFKSSQIKQTMTHGLSETVIFIICIYPFLVRKFNVPIPYFQKIEAANRGGFSRLCLFCAVQRNGVPLKRSGVPLHINGTAFRYTLTEHRSVTYKKITHENTHHRR